MLFIWHINFIFVIDKSHLMKRSYQRKAKLHYKSVPRLYDYKQVPWLNLSGHWLEKAGFKIGDLIAVSVGKNTLTIKKVGKASQVRIC
jgi:toxic protein SymE